MRRIGAPADKAKVRGVMNWGLGWGRRAHQVVTNAARDERRRLARAALRFLVIFGIMAALRILGYVEGEMREKVCRVSAPCLHDVHPTLIAMRQYIEPMSAWLHGLHGGFLPFFYLLLSFSL